MNQYHKAIDSAIEARDFSLYLKVRRLISKDDSVRVECVSFPGDIDLSSSDLVSLVDKLSAEAPI